MNRIGTLMNASMLPLNNLTLNTEWVSAAGGPFGVCAAWSVESVVIVSLQYDGTD